jgi:hypothetical protein
MANPPNAGLPAWNQAASAHDQYNSTTAYLARRRWPNLSVNVDRAVGPDAAIEPKLRFAELILKLEDAPVDIRLSENFISPRDHRKPENRVQGILSQEGEELINVLTGQYGLCKSTVELLLQHTKVEGLALAQLVLSQLPLPNGQPGTAMGHADCSLTQCHALQNKPDIENTAGKHVCRSRPCGKLEVREDEITTTYHTINLLFLPRNSNVQVDLTSYVKREDLTRNPWAKTKYVAISYVWAQMHPITQCQLQKLMPCLKRLLPDQSTLPIWLDFFCIPQSEEHAEAKARGLGMMPVAYEKATWVLVVDDLLLRTSHALSGTAIGMMILASQWMRRLWTLPEAVNATLHDGEMSRLVFCLRDGHLGFSEILKRIDEEDWILGAHVGTALRNLLLIPRSVDIRTKLRKLFVAMEYRGTSREEDEAPCLAGILCSSGTRIKWPLSPNKGKAGADTRIKHLFGDILTRFPLSIMFMEGERLDGPRFSWLPSSLIAGDTQLRPQPSVANPFEMHRQEAMAEWSDEGLMFAVDRAVVFSFDSNSELNFSRIYVNYQTRNPELDDPHADNPRTLNWAQIRLDQTHWERRLEKKNSGSPYGPGQGWRQLDQARPNDQLVLIRDDNNDRQGVILNMESWDDDVIRARFVCRAYVTRNDAFRMWRGPRPAGQQPLPDSQALVAQVPREVLHARQMSSASAVSGGVPLAVPGQAGTAEEEAREAGKWPQEEEEEDEWVIRREDNGPLHGIVSPIAYEVHGCTVILVG